MGCTGFVFLSGKYPEDRVDEAFDRLIATTRELCEYSKAKGGPRVAGEANPYDPAMASLAADILIVDDESKNRKLLEMWLRREGYTTRGAASAELALAAIAQRVPDLILLDVVMPGMDGYELAGILKAARATAGIPIIMVTMHVDRSARLAGLNAGAEEFLTRPVDRIELSLRVRNLLRFKTFSDFFRNHNWMLEQQVLERTADLQRFRTAMDATGDGIFLVNRSTMRFVEVNATACSLLGYTREELLGSSPSLFAIEPLEQLEKTYDDIIAGHDTSDFSEARVRLKDGSQLHVEVHRQAQRSGADWIIVSVMRDITERKEAEKHLHHLAHHDTLTGLPNRTLFYQTLRKTLAQASDKGWLVAVLFIDLDRFKNVNDTLGHAIGDELLDQFSNRLVQCVRVRDTVGRLGAMNLP
jgi:PAS domain S-box-containing protein